jgi:rsbT co-antagonist protein RsbR
MGCAVANILEAIQKNQDVLLEEWLQGIKSGIRRRDLIDERELKTQVTEYSLPSAAFPVRPL